MMTTIKQDDSLTNAEKDKQLAKLRAQLDNEETDRQLMFLQSSNHFSKVILLTLQLVCQIDHLEHSILVN